MTTSIFLAPYNAHSNVKSIRDSLAYGLQEQGYRVAKFHPFTDLDISMCEIEKIILNDGIKPIIEAILNNFDEISNNNDFVIISGLYRKFGKNITESINPYVKVLNQQIISAINAKVILISAHLGNDLEGLNAQFEIMLKFLGNKIDYLGAIVTKLNAPQYETGEEFFSLVDDNIEQNISHHNSRDILKLPVFKLSNIVKPGIKRLDLLGAIGWQDEITYPRVQDAKTAIDLDVLACSKLAMKNRIKQVTMCSRSIQHLLQDLVPDAAVITAADRGDIICGLCLAVSQGFRVSALILTGIKRLEESVKQLCFDVAKKHNLAILGTSIKSVNTVIKAGRLDSLGIAADDEERFSELRNIMLSRINLHKILSKLEKRGIGSATNTEMSPPAFRYHLIKSAKKAHKRIVLPEGTEVRIIQAAKDCSDKGIAECILVGNVEKIQKTAKFAGIELPTNIKIVDPKDHYERYLGPMRALRKHKALSEPMAKAALLEDSNVFGTMMLQMGDVDGLVSGADHTTANVLHPALQIIKTKPDCSRVSSVFFMCMPDSVLVYGDCAVNQNPTAEQLADIAEQSAITAMQFGIDPRVAMISYSTGDSGMGDDVEKVKKATKILQAKRPDLLIDGPLQYDAATIKSVAKKKAPKSKIEGNASVLIFPDLNTGNTVYKAVQRSAGVLSIGPVLQGIRKPVNDLSRGATVDDIIFTIAVTALQA